MIVAIYDDQGRPVFQMVFNMPVPGTELTKEIIDLVNSHKAKSDKMVKNFDKFAESLDVKPKKGNIIKEDWNQNG